MILESSLINPATNKATVISINSLQQYEREVVKWITAIETSNATLCLHLKELFLKRFAASEKNCDPFSHHGNNAISRKRKDNILSKITL